MGGLSAGPARSNRGHTIDTHDHRPATIIDVAREAGVSFKTVSRVLNGEPNVREPTRQRVRDAVRVLGYRTNPYARNLRAAQSRLIAVFFLNPSRNYTSEIQIGVLERCNAEGFNVIFEQAPDGPAGLVSLKTGPDLAGVILVPPLSEDPELLDRLRERAIPFVRISPAAAAGEIGRVSMDDTQAAVDMTAHLIGMGHRRIALIAGAAGHAQARQRLEGYRRALSAGGIEFRPELVVQGDYQFESGRRATEWLLSLPEPPTAIFATNDDMAAGVLAVAYRRGLRVPGDLSVAGFDDTPLASVVAPALTTIYQPIRELADRAASLLLQKTDPEAPVWEILPHRLVVRESTAPPKG